MYRTTLSLQEGIAEVARQRAEKTGNSIPGQIERDLNMLYVFLARERKLIRGQFTEAEAKLMIDCLNGTIMDQVAIQVIEANFQDGIALDGLDRKWKVDKVSFLAKFDGMSVLRKWALFEIIQDFWNAVSQNPETNLDKYVEKYFV